MKRPVLLGDILAAVFAEIRAHDMDAAFAADWTDVEHVLIRPCIAGTELQIAIGRGLVDTTKYHGRRYAKRSDVEAYFGDQDYFVRLKFRHD